MSPFVSQGLEYGPETLMIFHNKVEISGPTQTEKSPKQSIRHRLMDISFCTGHLEVEKKPAQILG